jgi:C-terminal processing protease CtpA/Prc
MGGLAREERAVGLATVWSEVKYNYPMWHRHPDLDWDLAFRERVPEALAEQSDWQYYRLLQAFAALVKDSHVRVWMPEQVRETRGAPPVALWTLGEQFVVIGFAAKLGAGTGLALGDKVAAVDGVSTAEYAAAHVAPYQSSPTAHHLGLQVAWSLLEGPRGSAVDVRLRRPSGEEYGCRLTRAPAGKDAEWEWYGPLAPNGGMSAHTAAPGIGMIALRSFGYEAVVGDFDQALAKLGQMEGLILDLRTNGGGNSGWSDAIIGRLIQKPLDGMRERRAHYSPALRSWGLGENRTGMTWEEKRNPPLEPEDPVSFHGPLVLLTGAATHSAAEDFVGPLKTGGRAKTVGGTTAGSTGNPLLFELPGGGGFNVCTRYMLLPDGREFIGLGIPPDVEVGLTAADIAGGRDQVLERAVGEMDMRPSARELAR